MRSKHSYLDFYLALFLAGAAGIVEASPALTNNHQAVAITLGLASIIVAVFGSTFVIVEAIEKAVKTLKP